MMLRAAKKKAAAAAAAEAVGGNSAAAKHKQAGGNTSSSSSPSVLVASSDDLNSNSNLILPPMPEDPSGDGVGGDDGSVGIPAPPPSLPLARKKGQGQEMLEKLAASGKPIPKHLESMAKW